MKNKLISILLLPFLALAGCSISPEKKVEIGQAVSDFIVDAEPILDYLAVNASPKDKANIDLAKEIIAKLKEDDGLIFDSIDDIDAMLPIVADIYKNYRLSRGDELRDIESKIAAFRLSYNLLRRLALNV